MNALYHFSMQEKWRLFSLIFFQNIQVEYWPVASCSPHLGLFHHFVTAGFAGVIFTIILIWIISAVIIPIAQKPPLYAPACNENQERHGCQHFSLRRSRVPFHAGGQGTHTFDYGMYRIYRWPFGRPSHTWKYERLDMCFFLFTHECEQKPIMSSQSARITCTTLKVISTVILRIFTVLSGHTVLSVSQTGQAPLPIKLSKDHNAPWTKLHKTHWKR